MITYVKRKDLDIDKYDTCIENSLQSNIYGFSWYLDIVADNWDVLVLDDYEAVMPIPWRKKYFIKYVSQPFFCQQLGVFSKENEPLELIQKFIYKIPFYFFKINYQLKSSNDCLALNFNKRTNYVLSLHSKYDVLKTNYRKDRKYRINQVNKEKPNLVSVNSKRIISLTKEHYSFMNLPNESFIKLEQLIDFSVRNNKGFIKSVLDNNQKLLTACFFLKSKNRIIYLFSVSTPEGKKRHMPSFIIDNVINEYANTAFLLDFEGSMIPGIASFYKSFGAVKEEYYQLKKNKIISFFRLFKS